MSGIFARCRLVGMKSTMLLRKASLRAMAENLQNSFARSPGSAACNRPQRRTMMVAVHICTATAVTALSNFPRCNPSVHTGGWRGRVAQSFVSLPRAVLHVQGCACGRWRNTRRSPMPIRRYPASITPSMSLRATMMASDYYHRHRGEGGTFRGSGTGLNDLNIL